MNWQRFKKSLSDAFAYDDGRSELTPEDHALLDKVAQWVVQRKLSAPAILMLEGTAPLNFVGSSLMTFFRPVVGLAFNTTQWERFEVLLEKRCTMHILTEKIEQKEAELRLSSAKKGDTGEKESTS